MGCFADDTAFWTTPSIETSLKCKLLQTELYRFTDWSKYWQMSINPSKCSFISIHKKNKPPSNNNYKIENTTLSQIDNCKYLGLWIDPTLSLKTHISKVQNKLQKHLYHLYFLQKSGIKLLPKTIIQIYKAKSRPCIEYASIFFFHKDTTNIIQTFQNKFIRAAYPCRKSTPLHNLHMIANLAPIATRINYLILRHWYRAKFSSVFHPLHKIIQQFTPSPNKHKSTFDLAYKILKHNQTNITLNHDIQPEPGHISALPKYDIFETPSNYTVSTAPIPPNQINPSDLNFYTDGSCSPNPGKGAFSWFSPNYNGHKHGNEICPYTYPISITNCEIMAIHSSLNFIKNNPPTKPKVNIFTDCKTVLQY